MSARDQKNKRAFEKRKNEEFFEKIPSFTMEPNSETECLGSRTLEVN